MNKLKKGQTVVDMVISENNYFQKRKEVMEIIYELKKYVDLPRIEVKIAETIKGHSTAGRGYTDSTNAIVISGKLEGMILYAVVLHEIVHTAFKYKGHNEKCILMCSSVSKGHSKEKYLQAFLKYAKNNTQALAL